MMHQREASWGDAERVGSALAGGSAALFSHGCRNGHGVNKRARDIHRALIPPAVKQNDIFEDP
jgi:hypothetical protein